MKKTEQKQWWKDQKWDGCMIRPPNVQQAASEAPAAVVSLEPFSWSQWAVPTINQHGSSCVGQAWANNLEKILRRYCGMDVLREGEQIDGFAIWKRARQMYYSGTLTGGLFLWQGFDAMLDLGIIPPETTMVRVSPFLEDICLQLKKTPMVQGHLVSAGWYEPNPENGCLDHSKLPGPADGGHATDLDGITLLKNIPFVISQNSWGPDYGFHGHFTMSWGFWKQCYIGEGPCALALPDGWETHAGWKKYVTKEAQ